MSVDRVSRVAPSQGPAGRLFLGESGLLVRLLVVDGVLFTVFEKLVLEVVTDLDKDFSVAFARHLGSL